MLSDISKNTMNYNYTRYQSHHTRLNRKSNALVKGVIEIALITALMMLLAWAFTTGLDKHIENQDTMLCESAKVSGNAEYLKKCQCYYSGEDIKCLQK